MDFGFSEEQHEVQNLARTILSEQVTPERLAQFDDFASQQFDRSLWQQLANSGLLGIAIDEQYGGMGFGFTELSVLIEEAGRTIAPVPLISHLVSSVLTVQQFGSDDQKKRWLPGAADGSLLLSAALMEEQNENPASPELTVSNKSTGVYQLNGSKSCVPFAGQAGRILLSAKTGAGVIVILLDPTLSGVTLTPLKVSTYEPQYQVTMNDVCISEEDILCHDDGAVVMQWVAERTIAAVCAHQLGVTDKAMRMTASYTSERKQFGVPVATFQAVGHRAANCFIDVECLKLNTYQAISRLDSGLDSTNEVTIAKIWAGDVGHRVSYASQHLHGGMGIDRDYPLWRYCLWMRHNELILGSSARHLALLGKRIADEKAFCN